MPEWKIGKTRRNYPDLSPKPARPVDPCIVPLPEHRRRCSSNNSVAPHDTVDRFPFAQGWWTRSARDRTHDNDGSFPEHTEVIVGEKDPDHPAGTPDDEVV